MSTEDLNDTLGPKDQAPPKGTGDLESAEVSKSAVASGDPQTSIDPPAPGKRPALTFFRSLIPGRWIEENERGVALWESRFTFAQTVTVGLVAAIVALLFDLPGSVLEAKDRRQRLASKVTPDFSVVVNEVCPREGAAKFEVVLNLSVNNEGVNDVVVKRVGLALEILGVPRYEEATHTLPAEPLLEMWETAADELECDEIFRASEPRVELDCNAWKPTTGPQCVVVYEKCRVRSPGEADRYKRDQKFTDAARYIISIPPDLDIEYLLFADVSAVVNWCKVRSGPAGWFGLTDCKEEGDKPRQWKLRSIQALHPLAGLDANYCKPQTSSTEGVNGDVAGATRDGAIAGMHEERARERADNDSAGGTGERAPD